MTIFRILINDKKNLKLDFNCMYLPTLIFSISILSLSFLIPSSISQVSDSTQTQIDESKQRSIDNYKKLFCGIDTIPNSNKFITEVNLINECEMPLAIISDINNNDSIWYISTKHGVVTNYNYANNTFSYYQIPIWKSRSNPIDASLAWDIKFDKSGQNLWFTDEKQNLIWKFDTFSKKFEHYEVPKSNSSLFDTSYPISLDFDNNGNIYFVGIRSHFLYYAKITDLVNGSSNGISSIPIPLDEFNGIDPDIVSTGSIMVDSDKSVWISLLAFNQKGVLLNYDLHSQSYKAYHLPPELSSPSSIYLDDKKNLWVTDHGTSIFFKLDTQSGNITKYTTSLASPKLFGDQFMSNAKTLPYWIKSGQNSSFWFNEHTGNKIAKFDQTQNLLIEYWIPTQNRLFGICADNPAISNCGIANALQISQELNNQIWFSEWSENKIAKLSTDSNLLPFDLSIPVQSIVVKRGDTKEISLNIYAKDDVSLNLISSGTFTPSGELGNSFGSFSSSSVSLKKGESTTVSFILTIAEDLFPSSYNLMIGAETQDISISKAINLDVID